MFPTMFYMYRLMTSYLNVVNEIRNDVEIYVNGIVPENKYIKNKLF